MCVNWNERHEKTKHSHFVGKWFQSWRLLLVWWLFLDKAKVKEETCCEVFNSILIVYTLQKSHTNKITNNNNWYICVVNLSKMADNDDLDLVQPSNYAGKMSWSKQRSNTCVFRLNISFYHLSFDILPGECLLSLAPISETLLWYCRQQQAT